MRIWYRYRSVVGINETEGDIPTLLGEKQMADFTQWVSKVRIMTFMLPTPQLHAFHSCL